MAKAYDLIGLNFGMLLVKQRVENNHRGEATWACICECGGERTSTSNRLTNGIVTSCGCKKRGSPRDDSIIGETFNGLRITGIVGRDRHREWSYSYRCHCGNTGVIRRSNIGKNRSCPHCRWGDYNGLTKGHWSRIEKNARDRNICLSITPQDAWEQFVRQEGRCALSGIELSLARSHTRSRTASLDRIDSNKSYEIGNIQWVHKVVNELKWDRSNQELIEWCERIVKYTHEQSSR